MSPLPVVQPLPNPRLFLATISFCLPDTRGTPILKSVVLETEQIQYQYEASGAIDTTRGVGRFRVKMSNVIGRRTGCPGLVRQPRASIDWKR